MALRRRTRVTQDDAASWYREGRLVSRGLPVVQLVQSNQHRLQFCVQGKENTHSLSGSRSLFELSGKQNETLVS